MSDVACHASCAKSCRDDTPISCDECAVGWWLAADSTGCQGKLPGSLYCTDKQMRWHAHSFNGPLSRTTRVSRYQEGKANLDFTEARDGEWHLGTPGKRQNMCVCVCVCACVRACVRACVCVCVLL